MQEAHLRPGNAVQIIGKVNPDLSVRVLSALDLGTGVGMFQRPHTFLAVDIVSIRRVISQIPSTNH